MRVITTAPLPPEKAAYALARYSRSADSFAESLRWVDSHKSGKFLENYYFQYGHASIADLGQLIVCFEDISEAAAIEIEDEQLWDGQARSTRYQDFSRSQPVIPADFDEQQKEAYLTQYNELIRAYQYVHGEMVHHLHRTLPKPEGMETAAYQRAVNARAFDVARYLLPLGIKTSVGQVTSIRTLERQVRRWLSSRNSEVRKIAEMTREALNEYPSVELNLGDAVRSGPVAPTLAKYLSPDPGREQMEGAINSWVQLQAGGWDPETSSGVRLLRPLAEIDEIALQIAYPHCQRSADSLIQTVQSGDANRKLISSVAAARGLHTELPRGFRNSPYLFEFCSDIGAYRDLHRHRRCQQFLQPFTGLQGYEVPSMLNDRGYGAVSRYNQAMDQAGEVWSQLWPTPGAEYILPMGYRCRYLFGMDFAEVEYIVKLRSGVKGHFSYRRLAWQMLQEFQKRRPFLAGLISATDPAVQDPLTR